MVDDKEGITMDKLEKFIEGIKYHRQQIELKDNRWNKCRIHYDMIDKIMEKFDKLCGIPPEMREYRVSEGGINFSFNSRRGFCRARKLILERKGCIPKWYHGLRNYMIGERVVANLIDDALITGNDTNWDFFDELVCDDQMLELKRDKIYLPRVPSY